MGSGFLEWFDVRKDLNRLVFAWCVLLQSDPGDVMIGERVADASSGGGRHEVARVYSHFGDINHSRLPGEHLLAEIDCVMGRVQITLYTGQSLVRAILVAWLFRDDAVRGGHQEI